MKTSHPRSRAESPGAHPGLGCCIFHGTPPVLSQFSVTPVPALCTGTGVFFARWEAVFHRENPCLTTGKPHKKRLSTYLSTPVDNFQWKTPRLVENHWSHSPCRIRDFIPRFIHMSTWSGAIGGVKNSHPWSRAAGHGSRLMARDLFTVIHTPSSLSAPMKWAYPQSYPHLWITSGGKLFTLWKTRGPLAGRAFSGFFPPVMHRGRTKGPEYAILYSYNLWNRPAPFPYNVVGTLQDAGCLESRRAPGGFLPVLEIYIILRDVRHDHH